MSVSYSAFSDGVPSGPTWTLLQNFHTTDGRSGENLCGLLYTVKQKCDWFDWNWILYLVHIISDSLCDTEDILREVKSMLFLTNVLIRKFGMYSHVVKCTLFRSYCLSLYDTCIGLWRKFTVTCINKFKSCYNKCIKSLLAITVDIVLHEFCYIETGLPCFETVIHVVVYMIVRGRAVTIQ